MKGVSYLYQDTPVIRSLLGKHQEQMLKQLIFITLTGFKFGHLPYINNHQESLGYFMPFCSTIEWLNKSLLSHKPMPLREGQDHSNWNQSVEFSSVKSCEQSSFLRTVMQNQFSMSFNKQTSCGSILHVIQINTPSRCKEPGFGDGG